MNDTMIPHLATSAGPYLALSTACRVNERLVEHLCAHPDFTKHVSGYSAAEISVLSDRGEAAYDDPLIVTLEGYVVEGYPLWQLAKLQKHQAIRCIVRDMSREQALLHIIEKNRGSKGINDLVRILLAFELVPWFRDRAKLNQRLGGRAKGSSQLTEADRPDVRCEIARAAGVSVENVSKVRHILSKAVPELQETLRIGAISICRGAMLARIPEASQRRQLTGDVRHQGIHRTIDDLLTKHKVARHQVCDGLRDIQRGLRKLQHEECLSPLLEPLTSLTREIESLLTRAGGINRAA